MRLEADVLVDFIIAFAWLCAANVQRTRSYLDLYALPFNPPTDCGNRCCAGKGKFTFASGSYYTGEFTDGKMHGRGKLAVLITAADGSVSEVAQEGVWQEGVFVPPVDASKPGSGRKGSGKKKK